jgi:hypothetical protein
VYEVQPQHTEQWKNDPKGKVTQKRVVRTSLFALFFFVWSLFTEREKQRERERERERERGEEKRVSAESHCAI